MHMIKILTPKYFSLNCKFIVPGMTYEDYLIEVLNSSQYFKNKIPFFEQYKLSKEESNGENDVISSQYCIDFKLLVDEETMNIMNKNKPEVDYSKMNQGFVFVKTKENPTPLPSSNILLDLADVKTENIQSGMVSSTIKNLLKNLKKDKNLFFYYPYEFSSKVDISPNLFESILNISLSTLMNYRENEQPNRDTYVCIKANKFFLIYEWVESCFVFRDEVHEMLCSNYMDANLYSVY